MILSNVELFAALDVRRLVIDPEPRPRLLTVGDPGDYCPYDTHAVDLTLGTEITVPEQGTYAYDLMQPTPWPSSSRGTPAGTASTSTRTTSWRGTNSSSPRRGRK